MTRPGIESATSRSQSGRSTNWATVPVGCGSEFTHNVRLYTRVPWWPATSFLWDWPWNIFYCHSLPSADSRRAVVISVMMFDDIMSAENYFSVEIDFVNWSPRCCILIWRIRFRKERQSRRIYIYIAGGVAVGNDRTDWRHFLTLFCILTPKFKHYCGAFKNTPAKTVNTKCLLWNIFNSRTWGFLYLHSELDFAEWKRSVMANMFISCKHYYLAPEYHYNSSGSSVVFRKTKYMSF